MDENQTPDTATENHSGEDAVEPRATVAAAKPRYQIDLFQTARVHTEQYVEEFDTEAEAHEFIKSICKDKGIEADYELQLLPEPEEVTPVSAEEAAEKSSEPESEISPEGSDEKTTQENTLPVN